MKSRPASRAKISGFETSMEKQRREKDRGEGERERDMVAGVREIPRSSEFLTRPCYTSNFQIESRRFVIPPSSVVR